MIQIFGSWTDPAILRDVLFDHLGTGPAVGGVPIGLVGWLGVGATMIATSGVGAKRTALEARLRDEVPRHRCPLPGVRPLRGEGHIPVG